MSTTEMHPCEVCDRRFEREAAAQFGPWRGDRPATICSLECVERLEAAAPEMLAALRLVQPFAVRRPFKIDPEAWEDAMDAVGSAISKAEGQWEEDPA